MERGWDNPLVSEPKSQKSKKLPYKGLPADVPPSALQGLRLRGIVRVAHAPGFPMRVDSSLARRGYPLATRVQPPLLRMACWYARLPAYHIRGPDRPLSCPTEARTSPQPKYVTTSAPLSYTACLRHLHSFLTRREGLERINIEPAGLIARYLKSSLPSGTRTHIQINASDNDSRAFFLSTTSFLFLLA